MELPEIIRETLLTELESYIENTASDSPAEALVRFVLESLEVAADEEGIDDVLSDLAESAALDGQLSEVLEDEMTDNEEFERTADEIIVLLERVCEIEWT